MAHESKDPTEVSALELTGFLEKIVFYNAENAYAVFLLTVDEGSCLPEQYVPRGKKAIMCVGLLVDPKIGQHLRLTGSWSKHQKYGVQFSFSASEEIYPTSTEGIIAYLTSGVIQGLGTSLAKSIVEAFGEETFTILDKEPKRLLEIRGLGKKTYEKIAASWAEHTVHRNLALFLKPYGIGFSLSTRILHILGETALAQIRENPYCLAEKIRGISFATADRVGEGLGFAKDNPLRLRAGIVGILDQAVENGNVYLPSDVVRTRLSSLCTLSDEDCTHLLQSLVDAGLVVLDTDTVQEGVTAVYLSRFYRYETEVAEKIASILSAPKSVVFPDANAAAEGVLRDFQIVLADEQREAIRMAALSKMMVLTGGPGTGKTTIIRAIIKLFAERGATIELAAPTGRAARRMQETTGHDAKTVHRLLEFTEAGWECARNEENPIKCDVIIVDEASMIDIVLFYHLLCAIPLGCTVILVGDVYQLPSVGPGTVLLDIITSNKVSLVKLTRIFRQSAESAIVRYAHQINQGIVPDFAHDTEKKTDFYFIEESDPEQAAKTITDLVKRRLPNYYHFAARDIQVVSPMRAGAVGITALNRELQEALNPNGAELRRGQQIFRVNDKVMQIRNNYTKDVVNGDIGVIREINTKESSVLVMFDDLEVVYSFGEVADELSVAYAISIHKSQGSEYPAVVIPLMTCHSWMLQRNLLYTAITRGKKLVVLIGERSALWHAVHNTTTIQRLTALRQRLAAI